MTSRIQQKVYCAPFQAYTLKDWQFLIPAFFTGAFACGIQLPCYEEVQTVPQRDSDGEELRLLANILSWARSLAPEAPFTRSSIYSVV